MALADDQIGFGGLTAGAGTPYRILLLKGVRDMPPLQTSDTPRLTADGAFFGYDTALPRVIDAAVIATGTSASDFEANLAALEAAMAPLLNSTYSLHWRLRGQAEKKIECRPRRLEDQILPTYRRLWTRVDLQWAAPLPAIVAA